MIWLWRICPCGRAPPLLRPFILHLRPTARYHSIVSARGYSSAPRREAIAAHGTFGPRVAASRAPDRADRTVGADLRRLRTPDTSVPRQPSAWSQRFSA